MNASATMNEAAGPALNGAAVSLTRLIADIEEVLGKSGHSADPDVANLRADVLRKVAAAKSGFSAGGRRITEAARKATTAADSYVRHRPWQAIAVAAVAGAAVGYLLVRGRSTS